MTINLVHETAHSFKMDDVYDDVGHDIDNATECVMERFDAISGYYFYQDVLDGIADPFCSSCDEIMKGKTENITITGN